MPKMYCYIVTQKREVEVTAPDPVCAARLAHASLRGLSPGHGVIGEVLTPARESDLAVNEIGEVDGRSR